MNTNDTLLQGHLSYTCVRLGDFHLSYESSIWFCAVSPLLNSLCKSTYAFLVRNSCLKYVSRGNHLKIKGRNWMHSTISYIKRIFAFQRGLQIQLHNESLWKWQQLHMPQNMNLSVFLSEPGPLLTARGSKCTQMTTYMHINAQISLNVYFWKIWSGPDLTHFFIFLTTQDKLS